MAASFINSLAKRRKTPAQLVRTAAETLGELVQHQQIVRSPSSSITEEVAATIVTPISPTLSETEKRLCGAMSELKAILYGEADKEVEIDKATELSRSCQAESFIPKVLNNFLLLPFEARKDAAQIFNNLVHKNIANFVQYISANIHIVDMLIDGYNQPDIALNGGAMLRECVRYDDLARAILYSDKFWLFFSVFVHLPNFEVSSDAFNTLRELLTTPKNKALSAEFLEENFERVFKSYDLMLLSENYVTRRRSLKLLSSILLQRDNFNVMIRYISSKENLKVIMNQLRDESQNIQFEAFHVFKIFVAYPNKPTEISSVLYRNKTKLLSYLESFCTDSEDVQFQDERRLLIETLCTLEKPEEPKSVIDNMTGGCQETQKATFSPLLG